MQKSNFYVLTGGPGSGKTSVLQELERRGYICIPEVARPIIKEQISINGNALPWKNREKYSELMLQHSVRDFIQYQNENNIWHSRYLWILFIDPSACFRCFDECSEVVPL